MAAMQEVTDRAAFWAELGAVSAPALLGRLGRSLAEASAKDAELGAAMHLAAAHVRQNCLVWAAGAQDSGGKSDESAAPWPPPAERRTPRGESVAELWLAEGEADSQNDQSDSDSDSDQLLEKPPVVVRLLPPCCPRWPMKLLPALGVCVAHVAWLLVMAACIPLVLSQSGRRFDAEGMSHKVGKLVDYILAMKLALCIPMVATTRFVAMDSGFCEALRAHLHSPGGPAAKRFVRRGMCTAIMIMMAAFLLEHERNGMSGDLYSKFFIGTSVVALTCTGVFLALVKLSVDMVEGLRRRAAEPEMSARFWKDLTCDYLATCDAIDSMWRKSGYSTALSLVLAFDVLFASCFGAIGLADVTFSGEVTTWRPWCWTAKQIIIVCVILYFVADIHSICSSSRNAKRSLLYIARHCLGRTNSACFQEHAAFIQCVEGVPCGVELAITPVLTTEFIAPMVKVFFAIAPLVAGFAYSMAQFKTGARGHARPPFPVS